MSSHPPAEIAGRGRRRRVVGASGIAGVVHFRGAPGGGGCECPAKVVAPHYTGGIAVPYMRLGMGITQAACATRETGSGGACGRPRLLGLGL